MSELQDPEESPQVRVVDKRWWARDADGAEAEDAGAGTPGGTRPSYVAELERQIADRDEKLAELSQRLTESSREFEQTRGRLRREVAKDVAREIRGVLGSFLETIDNLDRAIAAAGQQAEGSDALLEGVRLVREQFLSTLGRYGVTRLEAEGQSFDPTRHDAISTAPVTDPAQDGVIVTVVAPGYLVDDEVLRPASVIVGKLEATKEPT